MAEKHYLLHGSPCFVLTAVLSDNIGRNRNGDGVEPIGLPKHLDDQVSAIILEENHRDLLQT